MIVKIKRLNEKAVLPTKANITDAGLDLTCTDISSEVGEDGVMSLVYHTGIAIEIPENHVGLLFPRSSISKKSLTLTNCVGVIDSGYRGEVMAKFKINLVTNAIPMASVYKPEERFAQLIIMPIPQVELEWSEELTESERGEGGYGSSDLVNNVTTVTEDDSQVVDSVMQ